MLWRSRAPAVRAPIWCHGRSGNGFWFFLNGKGNKADAEERALLYRRQSSSRLRLLIAVSYSGRFREQRSLGVSVVSDLPPIGGIFVKIFFFADFDPIGPSGPGCTPTAEIFPNKHTSKFW